MKVKNILPLLTLLLASSTQAEPASASPEVVVIDNGNIGRQIPSDFLGLSFESSQLLSSPSGSHEFSSDNLPLENILRALGIKSLRFGGNLADSPTSPDPKMDDAKPMFELARKVGSKVIYTVRFTKGGSRRPFEVADADAAAAACRQILQNYADCLDSFTIGNEPNMYFNLLEKQRTLTNQVSMTKEILDRKAYEQYLSDWQKFAQVVSAKNPAARFNGPSSTGNPAWANWFQKDTADDNRIAFISNHYYPGGNGKVGDNSPRMGAMLSDEWHELYQKYLNGNGVTKTSQRPFRIEECNSFYNGGAPDVSDTLGAALWAVDYAHWFAEHGCAGINFHTSTHPKHRGNYLDYSSFVASTNQAGSGYEVRPLGYALLLLRLGSEGCVVPIEKPLHATSNLSVYAVAGTNQTLLVTLVNRNTNAPAATVQIKLREGKPVGAGKFIALKGSSQDVRSKTGITVGADAISPSGQWSGKWDSLPESSFSKDGTVSVTLEPASAMVVRLALSEDNNSRVSKSPNQTTDAHNSIYPVVYQNQ